jgi:TraM recognition site of TraD and TraG/Type IV secretion-system coupling protein DNA-binding domain
MSEGGRFTRPLLVPEVLILSAIALMALVLGFPIGMVAFLLIGLWRSGGRGEQAPMLIPFIAALISGMVLFVLPYRPGAPEGNPFGIGDLAGRYLSAYLELARVGYAWSQTGEQSLGLADVAQGFVRGVWPLGISAGVFLAGLIETLRRVKGASLKAPLKLVPEERHAAAVAFPRSVEGKAREGVIEHSEPWLGLTRRVAGHPIGGVSVGWTPDGAPFAVDVSTMNRGALVSGTNGAGKTNLLELLLYAAADGKRPALLIDFKGSDELLLRVEALGGVCWSFDRPSPMWNPMQGNASEVAAKVTAVEGTQTGNQWNTVTAGYVQLAVRAMHETKVSPEPTALAALMNPGELQAFISAQVKAKRLTPERASELDREVVLATDAEAGFDVRPLGSVASRMRGIVHGTASAWLGQPGQGQPYLDVLAQIRAGRIVLFSINANRYGLPARRLGAWVLAEAMRVSASLGSAWGRTNRCLYLIDEFSSLEEYGKSINKVLAMGRENGVGVWLFTQSLSRLKTELGEGGAGVVADALGNCNIKIVLRHPEPQDAQEWSKRFGSYDLQQFNQSLDPQTGTPTGTVRHRMVETPYVQPRDVLTLPDYHAFVQRVGDAKPSLVRLTRAVTPLQMKEQALLPVWSGPVWRWPEPPLSRPEVPPKGDRGGDTPGEQHPPQQLPSGRGHFLPGRQL